MIENIKVFLEQYTRYNENEILKEPDEVLQATYYGKLQCIAAIKNLIEYYESEE